MNQTTDIYEKLDRDDLAQALKFMKGCLSVTDETEFHELILEFAAYLGYEYVLYCFMNSTYDKGSYVHMVNLSNPVEWMSEYDEKGGYLEDDPVRYELEEIISKKRTGGQHLYIGMLMTES